MSRSFFDQSFTERDPEAQPVLKGPRDDGFEPDQHLRDFETLPLKEDIDKYFEREASPHVHDALDGSKQE